MYRVGAAVLVALGVLTGCTADGEQQPRAERGSAALTERLDTMDQVIGWVEEKAGECERVVREKPADLRAFVGSDIAALYEPYVTEWATCAVSAEYPKVGLLLFGGDRQIEFQRSWRQAMTEGKIGDGPTFAFGNGFAVSAGFLGVSALDLYYFRCDYHDERVPRVPADVDGCVYADPEHGHH
ncbi:hypothetical protein [Amycolatopsis albispora]|uniref:Lipoprotein n=1 Tax=Amycolatopsis albispora TaxID=1804986 RepID=A0A344L2E1_9PSEU|nr:hypothetical protein [Amycolatopsis albispora]AXB42215.1 hypothetical protein A4R43_06430 [Amycolatopsis albispora]